MKGGNGVMHITRVVFVVDPCTYILSTLRLDTGGECSRPLR